MGSESPEKRLMDLVKSVHQLPLVFAIIVGTSATAGAEPWRKFRGHRYRLTPQAGDWHAAERYARSVGGHLVAINSAREQKWLIETFGAQQLYWIGCTDEKREGKWRWTTGEKVTYTNWYAGEPNDQGGEDYTITNFREPGKWNDLGPGSPEWGPHHGIVEVGPVGEAVEVPDGLVLVETREGCRCFGELPWEALTVETSYGDLTIPVEELREVLLVQPGEEQGGDDREIRVATARFAAVGRIRNRNFQLKTKYGTLVFPRSDIRRLVFGRSIAKPERPL